VLLALFVDLFVSRHPGFGWMQGFRSVIGAIVILAGVYLWSRKKTSA